MVRRPAAVLALLALAQLYLLLAPKVLPAVGSEDAALFLDGAFGSAAILLMVAAVVPATDVPPLAILLVVGAGLVTGALDVAGVGASASLAEAAAYGGLGALFALGLLSPALALGLPVVVAAVDVVSSFGGGPSQLLGQGVTRRGDPLSLAFADWGTQLPAGRLGISDAVFAGVFLLFARRLGLRPAATAAGLWVAILVALLAWLAFDASIPVLPLMAVAFFAVNADRLPALLQAALRE